MGGITLINAVAISDTKDKVYASDGYKITKKNKTAMLKEIEKLNKEEYGRYELGYAMILKSGVIQTFNSINY